MVGLEDLRFLEKRDGQEEEEEETEDMQAATNHVHTTEEAPIISLALCLSQLMRRRRRSHTLALSLWEEMVAEWMNLK